MTDKTLASRAVTIVDVARAAGVSHSTVSRVLNDRRYVKEATRKRVLKAATDLGYVVNLAARSLAAGRLGVIGVVSMDLTEGYILEIVRSVDRSLTSVELELMLATTHDRPSTADQSLDRLSVGLCDGLIVVLPSPPRKAIESLAKRHYPVVLVDQPASAWASTVIAENEQGAFAAIDYLAGLGHRRIGCVAGDMATAAARGRVIGWRRALQTLGLDQDDRLLHEASSSFRVEAGRQGARALLDRSSPPTAILAPSDVAAQGVLLEAKELGLDVPGDLSVIGFDDIPEASTSTPALTTVRQPLRAMGATAVELLTELLDSPAEYRHVELPTELVIRSTTASPAH